MTFTLEGANHFRGARLEGPVDHEAVARAHQSNFVARAEIAGRGLDGAELDYVGSVANRDGVTEDGPVTAECRSGSAL